MPSWRAVEVVHCLLDGAPDAGRATVSLNEGFWSLWRSPWSEEYRLGDVVLADLERDLELGREMRRADPRVFDRPPWSAERRPVERLAARRVQVRELLELGYPDLGGECE